MRKERPRYDEVALDWASALDGLLARNIGPHLAIGDLARQSAPRTELVRVRVQNREGGVVTLDSKPYTPALSPVGVSRAASVWGLRQLVHRIDDLVNEPVLDRFLR
jgi:hypothetical protein